MGSGQCTTEQGCKGKPIHRASRAKSTKKLGNLGPQHEEAHSCRSGAHALLEQPWYCYVPKWYDSIHQRHIMVEMHKPNHGTRTSRGNAKEPTMEVAERDCGERQQQDGHLFGHIAEPSGMNH
mmetsp:Transcript_146808/g.256377  ORF Transcript_146808/g.256377 Transcript_146808/m.256377 type:complete len:123 (-) Transcript_146808:28-396(-)